jgi:hypothetical protein
MSVVVLIVVWIVLYLLPCDFLMDQSCCSERVVVTFHTVYFYVSVLVFFILRVYPHFVFQRLASLYVRLQPTYRFTYHPYSPPPKKSEREECWFLARGFSTLKMKATRSSETSVQFTRSTRRHIPEGGILHSHRCENLKSHKSERDEISNHY